MFKNEIPGTIEFTLDIGLIPRNSKGGKPTAYNTVWVVHALFSCVRHYLISVELWLVYVVGLCWLCRGGNFRYWTWSILKQNHESVSHDYYVTCFGSRCKIRATTRCWWVVLNAEVHRSILHGIILNLHQFMTRHSIGHKAFRTKDEHRRNTASLICVGDQK